MCEEEISGYDLITRLIDEYSERVREGNASNIDEYIEACVKKYPQHAEEIQSELRDELDIKEWAEQFFDGASLTEDLSEIDMDAVWDKFHKQIHEIERNASLRRRITRRIRLLLFRLFK